MKCRCLVVLLVLNIAAGGVHAADRVLLECENFADIGGWVIDQQFMDEMGSPFLLAHGLGDPVRDAVTTAKLPSAGTYRVWARTRDWVAPWKTPGAPGQFQVLIDGKPLATTFGTEGDPWHWQDGGTVEVGAQAKVALHDLTGFEGRCDAILFAKDRSFVPPNDRAGLSKLRRELLHLPEKPVRGGSFDLVVVGGGLAGECAAVAAARLGVNVALIQDRPVLGGNGSSEVRVWPEGNIHQKPYPRIGDLVAELVPEKTKNDGNAKSAAHYDDSRKLAVARAEPRLTLFLECRVNEVEAGKGVVRAVVCQNTRTARRLRIEGRWFADCTGDASVGFLAGADYEMTKEGHMGASNLFNFVEGTSAEPFPKCLCKDLEPIDNALGETKQPVGFPRCPWAVVLIDKSFPGRQPAAKKEIAKSKASSVGALGQWYWESGFDRDPIHDVERMRDLNLRAMYGAWDTLKNVDHKFSNYKLSWAAYVAGKRESRRLLGDVVLNDRDLLDSVAYPDGCFPCTWSIDLHLPDPKYQKGNEGDEFIGRATVGDKAYKYAGPYWAPYRCLYSRNVQNLFMAGRDISVTHEALGAVRVMKTGGMMGEVVGMAASICKSADCSPREVYTKYLGELKTLMLRGAGKAAQP
jgi:hypothetical protein